MTSLPASTCELLAFLGTQKAETFDLAGRIDSRRYLGRRFPEPLPLIMSLQQYPGYRRMVGENWMHWHDYYECFIALSGRGDFRSGNDRFLFDPGDIVIVDPLKIHGVMRMEAAHTALVILFPTHLIAQPASVVDQGFLSPWDRRTEGVLPLLKGSDPAAPAVHEALLKLTQVWFSEVLGEDRWVSLKYHFTQVLYYLRQAFVTASCQSIPGTDRALSEDRLRRSLDYVSLHAHESISQPEAARAAGMSTSRFRAFFKETTGWGFAQYVRELRVERAAKSLRDSDDSVAAIAHMTGFADQSHLLRCFKLKYGESPIAYRQRHRS
ncbi:MAG: AraC family transcriptional regulator [Prosthecobacter sp.]|nr:AraC family transcriptional regulator [Prosthecobacter sp.]